MRTTVVTACILALTSCRIELDDPVIPKVCVPLDVQTCQDAEQHSDFTWIHQNILKKNCTGSACHEEKSSSMKAKNLIFDDADRAYKTLVSGLEGQVMSDIEMDVPLVMPGMPNQSYLLFLMKGVAKEEFEPAISNPPKDVGFMPRGNSTLCCQKIDAVTRWIEMGAER